MDKNIVSDFIMGFQRGVNYHFHRYFSSSMKPIYLEFNITSKCNARCIMCNIWKDNKSQDLSLKEIESIISSPVLSDVKRINITGGEPFLRKDLIDIIRLMNSKLKNTREILIATNGLLTNVIVEQTKKILGIINHNVSLHVGISFDGMAKEHERIRNIIGIHNMALETVRRLSAIHNQNLEVQAHVAISPLNIDRLEDIYYYLHTIVDQVVFFPVIISEPAFKNRIDKNNLAFDSNSRSLLESFFHFLINEESPSPNTYYYSRLTDLLRTGKRNFPCTAGFRFMHIDAEGNINPCSFVPSKLSFGNIRNQSLENIWSCKESRDNREKLKNYDLCKKCTAHCDLYSVVREEFFDFLIFLIGHPKFVGKLILRSVKH